MYFTRFLGDPPDRRERSFATGAGNQQSGTIPFLRTMVAGLVASGLIGIDSFAGQLQPVSVPYTGYVPSSEGAGDSVAPVLSQDGRFVLYSSTANNLVALAGSNGLRSVFPVRMNVFIRDRTNGTTELVSCTPTGSSGGDGDSFPAAISSDGRYLLFESEAGNLVPNDTNRTRDVFLRDRLNQVTLLVSANTNGACANGTSRNPAMTADGRYVAFVSDASDLVAVDTNRIADVFVRDMLSGTTVTASVGARSPAFSYQAFGSDSPLLSADGRYVAFFSSAAGLLPGVGAQDAVWVRDLVAGQTICASSGALPAMQLVFSATNASAFNQVISSDGQFIAYEAIPSPRSNDSPGMILRYNLQTGTTDSVATNANAPSYALGDIRSVDMTPDGQFIAYVADASLPSNTNTCIKVWDARQGTISLVSGDTNNEVPPGSICAAPVLAPSGRCVAFLSTGVGLATNSLRGQYHIYRRDNQSNITELVDADDSGTGLGVSVGSSPRLSGAGDIVAFESGPGQPGGQSSSSQVFIRELGSKRQELISVRAPTLAMLSPRGSSTLWRSSLSSDGRYVAFSSDADNLVANDTNCCTDVFVRDRLNGTTMLVSVGLNGAGANGASQATSLSADGRYVAFTSAADNLVSGDTNRALDVFVRDVIAGTTTLVSVSSDGNGYGNADSHSPWLTTDGRHILFLSQATNLTTDVVSSGSENLFWKDLQSGLTVALKKKGVFAYSMTPDGQFVAFPGDFNGLLLWDSKALALVYTNPLSVLWAISLSPDGNRFAALDMGNLRVFDRSAGTNTYLGMTGGAGRLGLRFSGDGQLFAYATSSWMVTSDTNGTKDVYLYDFQTSSNTLVSRTYSGASGDGASDFPDISADGRFVVYHSFASNLLPGDDNGSGDIFLYDRQTGAASLLTTNLLESRSAGAASMSPFFTPDGRHILFESWGSDLVAGDYNSAGDIFALDLYPLSSIQDFGASILPDDAQGRFVLIRWRALAGRTYRVQFKLSLNDAQWQDVAGTPTIAGDQGSLREDAASAGARFYRVVEF